MAVMQIVGLMAGGPSPFDGQYLVEYDPTKDGVDPNGRRMGCVLRTTPDPKDALHAPSMDLFELWRSVDTRKPYRADGNFNRPLTAFTVEIREIKEV